MNRKDFEQELARLLCAAKSLARLLRNEDGHEHAIDIVDSDDAAALHQIAERAASRWLKSEGA